MEKLPPEGNIVSIDDFEMYYEIYGDGAPLFLLHGFTGSSSRWKPFIPSLAEHCQLIVPDLRGHGRSTNPSNEFTHRQSALDVFALAEHLRIDQFKAIGISTGGMTLTHMATQQPLRVEAMVLIGSTIYFGEECRTAQRDSANEGWWDWDELREIHKHGDEQIRNLLDQFHNFKDSYDDMNFTTPYLSTITANTLIIHGDRDLFFPVTIPVETYQAIPDSYLWVVPNGGHVPIIEEKHQAYFIEMVLEFLLGAWQES